MIRLQLYVVGAVVAVALLGATAASLCAQGSAHSVEAYAAAGQLNLN
jgi:hypothetical protein